MSLTVKQKRFIEEFCLDFNRTAAAKRAGYAPDSAHVTGHELLRNPKISAAVEKRLETLDVSAGVQTAAIMEGFRRIGFSDYRSALESIGWEFDEGLDDETAFSIRKLKRKVTRYHDKEGNVTHETEDSEIEMHDKIAALNALAKIRALFVDRVQHSIGNMPNVRIEYVKPEE